MAAGPWQFYESAREFLADGTIDLDTNTFKIALFTSSSNAGTLTTNDELADLTNQVANGDGYTTGGETLSGVTWTRSGATVTFAADNEVWTASGSGITARRAVIYRSGTVNSVADALVCTCLLDNTPADVSVTAGNTLTITLSSIFTLS
jgi:hypothetical protein